jgi:hypothetical protein
MQIKAGGKLTRQGTHTIGAELSAYFMTAAITPALF